jgi:Autotransporter beta-domain
MLRKTKRLAIIGIIGGCAIAGAPASAGEGIIGLVGGEGQNSTPALALVVPSSSISATLFDLSTSLDLLPSWGSAGKVFSCALNSSGSIGLVAGQQNGLHPSLALVIPSSTSAALFDLSVSLNSLPGWGTLGTADSCALNSQGSIGLVGGESGFAPALALVIPSSTSAALYDLSTSLKGLPGWGTSGEALGCALNSSGSIGLVAGEAHGAALALVIPSSTSAALYDLTTSLQSLPGWGSHNAAEAFSCALNSKGSLGLVAGVGQTGFDPALALVIPSSTSAALYDLSTSLKALPGWGTSGTAESCALNSSGSIGLVAGIGQGAAAPALALIILSSDPSATLFDLSTSLKALPGWGTSGTAESCALNSSGSIGLVAGTALGFTAPALALVIPSSTSATLYDLSTSLKGLPGWGTTGEALACALSSLTPTAIGPFGSELYTMMTESSALSAHVSYERMRKRLSHRPSSETAYLDVRKNRGRLFSKKPLEQVEVQPVEVGAQTDDLSPRDLHYPALSAEATYDIWLMPFGDLLHQKKQGSVPSFTNQVAGTLLGFDAEVGREGVIGGALGYAFDYVHYGQRSGHAKIHQETAVVYGSWNGNIGYVNGALWGGIYQVKNERHALFITSIGKMDGYLLSPHIEGGAVLRTPKDFFYIEPFGMVDWANSWRKSFGETGPVLNLDVPSHYTSMLRSEAGVRFYETITTGTLQILLVEKASYINQTPFRMGDKTVTFVGSDIPFSVAIGSTHTQNLGGAELHCWFIPLDPKSIYGSIDAEVEIGASFQSYLAFFTVGRRF